MRNNEYVFLYSLLMNSPVKPLLLEDTKYGSKTQKQKQKLYLFYTRIPHSKDNLSVDSLDRR